MQSLQHFRAYYQRCQSSLPSVQDVDNMRDSPSSAGVTKEIAVAVKESSRPLEKRIGQRTLAKRVTSGLPPRKSIRLLVCSRLIMFPI